MKFASLLSRLKNVFFQVLKYSDLKNPNIRQQAHPLPPEIQHWKLRQRIRFFDQQHLQHDRDHAAWISDFARAPQICQYLYLTPEQMQGDALQQQMDTIAQNLDTHECAQLFLPSGIFDFQQTLDIPSGIFLCGHAGTVLQFSDVEYALRLCGKADNILTHAGLRQLRILHQGDARFCAAVYCAFARHLAFEEIVLEQPRATGFLLADKVSYVQFAHCRVSGSGLTGFMLVRDVYEISLRQCRAEYCQQSGMFITDLARPAHIAHADFNAQIHHTMHEIGNFAPFDPQDPAPQRISLDQCVFAWNRKMGITTDGVGFLSIRNCDIHDNDNEGITIDNGSWLCRIEHSHIYQNGRRLRQTEEELGIDFVAQMGLMADGSSKAKLPGISIDNAAYVTISHNFIENNWGDGVKMVRAAWQCHIQHNLIRNNNRGGNDRFHFFGVLLGHAKRQHARQDDFAPTANIVAHNQIIGPHYAAIHLLPGCAQNRIKDNLCSDYLITAIEDHSIHPNQIEPC